MLLKETTEDTGAEVERATDELDKVTDDAVDPRPLLLFSEATLDECDADIDNDDEERLVDSADAFAVVAMFDAIEPEDGLFESCDELPLSVEPSTSLVFETGWEVALAVMEVEGDFTLVAEVLDVVCAFEGTAVDKVGLLGDTVIESDAEFLWSVPLLLVVL